MERISLGGTWTMTGNGMTCDGRIPGSVYSFLLENKRMEDPYYRLNELAALELAEHEYTFSRSFAFDKKDGRALLCCDGLDTVCDLWLNGSLVGHAENMHRRYEFDITKLLREENELKLVFQSANRYFKQKDAENHVPGNRDTLIGYSHLRKSYCMSGWDWGPRLPDAGIWRDIYLLVGDTDRIGDMKITQRHEGGRVFLTPCIATAENRAEVKVFLTAPDGERTEIAPNAETEIENPELWWPNGLGEQKLYTVSVELYEGGALADAAERKIGLRTMRLVREKDAYGEGFCHEVNGVKFFAMGADYIPEDCILSRVTPQRTRRLLEQCRDAHFNAVRVWGGGVYPNDDFYDSCDELGLVVFQDLMVACTIFPDEEPLKQEFLCEIRENLARIRHHACIALICGNNECEWMQRKAAPEIQAQYIELYEKRIPEIVREVCPELPYVPSSPSSEGHFIEPNNDNYGDCHFWEIWHGEKPFAEYRSHYFRYLSEFGFESLPDEKTVNSFTLPSDRNLFSRVMEAHQRCRGGNKKIIAYLSQTYLYPTQFGTLIYASQLLQAKAIQYAVEHLRSNRGRCMGALYWQLNDVWPVASWSSIDYYGRFKALQYFAKRFYAPVAITCRETGETTTREHVNLEQKVYDYETKAQLSVVNDTRMPSCGTVLWRLCRQDGSVLESGKEEITVPPLSVVTLAELDFHKTDFEHNYLWYEYSGSGCAGSVIFTAPKHFAFADPKLAVTRSGNTITVTAESYAQAVEIWSPDEDCILSDNFFDMEPGSRAVTILEGDPKRLSVRSVYDIR